MASAGVSHLAGAQRGKLDAAQLQVARAHLRQCGVLQLLRHLTQVLLDARCRAHGLFLLQAGQRGRGLAVAEDQADGARSQQRQADQRHDQQQVLAEQPATVGMVRRPCRCRMRRHAGVDG